MSKIIKETKDFEKYNYYNDDKSFIFEELFNLCEEADIEFVELHTFEQKETDLFDKIDASHTGFFRIFNEKLNKDELIKDIEALSDPEFANYKAIINGDLLIVSIVI